MKNLVFHISIVLLILAGGSCRSTRQIREAIQSRDTAAVVVVKPAESDSAALVDTLLGRIEMNRIQYTSFSSKVKVDYRDSRDRSLDVTAFLRMKRDSAIWISLNALGLEAIRVLITPDSVKVLDKRDKSVTRRSFSYLQEVAQLPIDFHILQDLIVGNPVYLEKQVLSYRELENTISLLTAGDVFRNLTTFLKPDYTLQQSKLDDLDVVRSRTCALMYTGYEMIGERRFSSGRKITIAEKTKLDIELDFKQVEFDRQLSFPFSIPRNYSLK